MTESFPPTTIVLGADREDEKTVIEISLARLAYLEACRAILHDVIHPRAEMGHLDAKIERKPRFARSWTDQEIENATEGASLWNDPPKGWRKPKLRTYFRGELVGRAIVAHNVGQHYWVFLKAIRDPVSYWRRWQIGYLDMHRGMACSIPSCTGPPHRG